MQEKFIRTALIGQPNVGKSTVFNHLTGLNQHVGNWPGKTIEQKTGKIVFKNYTIEICDLPGTYSLTSNSEEERIARDYIITKKPDVVIVLLNASALERSFYLLSELLLLEVPIVAGINMVDVAKENGIIIDFEILQEKIKIPVVELIASKNIGLVNLLEKVVETYEKKEDFKIPFSAIRDAHKSELDDLEAILKERVPSPYSVKWTSVKLLEGDKEITEFSKGWLKEDWQKAHKILEKHEDAYLDIVGSRYEWIAEIISSVVKNPRPQEISITDKIDKYATHPIYGMGLLFGIIGALFFLTYFLANPIVNFLSKSVSSLQIIFKDSTSGFLPPFISGLLFDGAFGGAGMVIAFLPTLLFFFFFIAILEDVGYLSRIAYIMDNFMHKIGLHGKSFVPLFLGFGCNVPAIMGTRIIEDKKARFLTILLTPFIPCSARFAVLAFLATPFFGKYSFLAMMALILINIATVFLIGKILTSTSFKGVKSAFIMELPLYHKPNFKTVFVYVYVNLKSFIVKAASIIVIVSCIVWFLSAYPSGKIDESYLAQFGKFVEKSGALMGFSDWRAITALATSFIAKENTIATFGVLLDVSENETLGKKIAEIFTIPSAFAFLVVQMLFVPCLATTTVIYRETGLKWTFYSLVLHLTVSLFSGIVTFQFLRLFLA
ncbi:MAG: ferrous iron transport protein B [Acidobacteriota bacterium]